MMVDAIRFKEFLCCNTEENKSIEADTKALFAYGGIHDFLFDDALEDSFVSLDAAVWGPAGAVWSIDTGRLKGIGSGAAAWYGIITDDDMPAEAIVTVDKVGARGGLLFRMTDVSNGYLFYWTAAVCGFATMAAGVPTVLIQIPKIFGGAAKLNLSWREMKFSSTADEKFLLMSAWVDGEFAVGTEDDITGQTVGEHFGFAVYDSDTVYFDNVRIPELTEIIGLCSVDVGRSAGSALSKMLGDRHIKYFLRYDGTLKMIRPKTGASTYTYDRSEHVTNFKWQIDTRELVHHWRQVGAWEEADCIDTALVQQGINRFIRDDNPNLLTQRACYNEALYAIQALKENSDIVDLTTPAQVLQEPEDIVTVTFVRDGTTIINAVDYIVDLDKPPTLTFKGGKLLSRLRLRKST